MLALALALTAVLIAPGPTNLVLMLAAAERPLRALPVLVGGVVLSYLAVCAPLAVLAQSLPMGGAWLRQGLAGLASVWVLVLALRLWRQGALGPQAQAVTPARLMITTLLNPKGLVFGQVLLPAPGLTSWELAARLTLFAGLALAVAALWAAGGAVMAGLGQTRPRLFRALRRGSALWLAMVAAALMARAIA